MNLNKEIENIEQKRDWKSAILLFNKMDDNEPEIYLRVTFLLLDFVVDGQYSDEEHDYVAENLIILYEKTEQKFSDNAEFLFFSGLMIYIGEWYFGMDNVDTGTALLQKAMYIEPQNILYKWGYYSRLDQRPEYNTDLKLELSEQLLFREPEKLDWLRSKGLLGEYVLGTLEETYEDLKRLKFMQ